MKVLFIKEEKELILELKNFESTEFSESGKGERKHIFLKFRNFKEEKKMIEIKNFLYSDDNDLIKIKFDDEKELTNLKCDSATLKTMNNDSTDNEVRYTLELTFSKVVI